MTTPGWNRRLYSTDNAARVRAWTWMHTDHDSRERRFMYAIVHVMTSPASAASFVVEPYAEYIQLHYNTKQYWPLVRQMCKALGFGCAEVENDFYCTITASRA